MKTTVHKWGNSQGLRLPRKLLEEAGLDVGSEVDVNIEDRHIVIRPARRIRGKYRIEDLVAAESRPGREVDWGKPEGREIW